jgi:hypothetical protein
MFYFEVIYTAEAVIQMLIIIYAHSFYIGTIIRGLIIAPKRLLAT